MSQAHDDLLPLCLDLDKQRNRRQSGKPQPDSNTERIHLLQSRKRRFQSQN